MDFERGQEVKEVLKIGRRANATIIEGYSISGTVDLPIKHGHSESYNDLHSYSTSDKEGTKLFLESLQQKGVIDSEDIKKFFLKSYIGRIKRRKFPLDLDIVKKGIIAISEFKISIRIEYDNEIGNIMHVLPSTLIGKDLLFENKLYFT